MLFTVAIFNCLLLVPAVLAVPSALGASVARRREGRQSQFNNRSEQTASVILVNPAWAGSVLTASNGNFTWAIGEFIVPTPSGSNGSSAAAWVGIDGDTCKTAILQAGVVFVISPNGQPKYGAWSQWLPNKVNDFSDITISAGDLIRLTVIALSRTFGKARIDNLTNGEKSERFLSSDIPLCGQNAEWIVEDYTVGTAYAPFANFSTVTFENAMAGGSGGIFNGSDGTLFNIAQNGSVLTSTSASGWSVTIEYYRA